MGGDAGKRKQLGKILLKQKLVTPDELEDLLELQKTDPGHRLASTAVSSGKVREVDLLKALSEQHGVPGIDLSQVVVPLANLKLIPSEIARQHLILPILVKEDRVFMAMADPADRRVVDEIEFVTGRKVYPYVAIHDHLQDAIERTYQLAERGEEYYIGPHVPPEYLRSLGLDSGAASQPEPMPNQAGGVVVDDLAFTEGDLEDELGIAELTQKRDPPVPASGTEIDSLSTPPKQSDTPAKVLIVDDEDDIRRLLKRVLSERGYEVVEASRGLEALQMVRSEVPDVILLDAMLPEVHGFDICRRIKGSKRYGHIPIIMVSAIYRGWRFAEDLKQSYQVEAFLEKPFKIADVMTWVERVLEGRAHEDTAEDDDLSREAGGCLEQGMAAYQTGDLDGAISELEKGVGIDPLSFMLHYHLGLLYGRREDIFEAIHSLETAVDLQPRHFSALKNLAVLYQHAGFKHKAVEMWERALANAPDEETRQGIKEHLMELL